MGDIGAIRITGPYHDISGYARLRRELALALTDLGVCVELAGGQARSPVIDDAPLLRRLAALERPTNARFVLHIDLPEWIAIEPGKINLLYSQFEADTLPARWIEPSRRCDLVLVPSRSSLNAWLAAGIPAEKLRVCPQGVRAEAFAEPIPSAALLGADVGGAPLANCPTRFLNVSDIGRGFRKNLGGLIGVWIAATHRDDDAALVLKWSDRDGADVVRRFFERTTRDVEAILGKRAADAAPIHLLTASLRDDELPGMYAACTHYLSVSSGEGWDLPMMEAGAAGLRLIAPDHSGYRAYLNERMATLLPARQVPADVRHCDEWLVSLHEGAKWWETDLDAAAAAIRDAIAGRDRYKPLAREAILRDFSWTQAAEQLVRILAAFEANAGAIGHGAPLVSDVAPDPFAKSNRLPLIEDLLAFEIAWERGADNFRGMADLHGRVDPLQQELAAETTVAQVVTFGSQPEAPALSVVVPLFGNLDHLETQLHALRDATRRERVEMLYVLDGPNQFASALEAARNAHQSLGVPFRMLVTNRRAGFSRACNLGASEAAGDYLLFLNSDAWPGQPDGIAALLDFARAHPEAGLIGPRLVYPDGRAQSAGQAFLLDPSLGCWVWRALDRSNDDANGQAEPAVVPGLSGACLLLSRDLIRRIGGFNETFVVGQFEDCDLSNRARQAGLQNWCVPTASFVHVGGESYGGTSRGKHWFYNAWAHHQRWGDFLEREAILPEAGSYLDLLRRLHRIIQPDIYVEIGVDSGRSLALASGVAVGIDPAPKPDADIVAEMMSARLFRMTSDDFFGSVHAHCLQGKIDLAFIDGDHRFEQVLRDFHYLETNGRPESVIVIHDVIPPDLESADPEFRPGAWVGDVWRIMGWLERHRPDLTTFLISRADAIPSGALIVTGLNPRNGMLRHLSEGAATTSAATGDEDYERAVVRYLEQIRTVPVAEALEALAAHRQSEKQVRAGERMDRKGRGAEASRASRS